MAERVALADRVLRYAPPPWRLFDAIVAERENWLVLARGEVDPGVLEAQRPERIVLGSPWPKAPGDTVELTFSPDESGAAMRFVWWTDSPPDERGIGKVRYRLNRMLSGDLRHFVDTETPAPGSRADRP